MAISLAGNQGLLVSYHRTRDPAMREALVHRFLPFARRLARRFQRPGHPFEDLNQVAAIGLLKAIDRFDPTRGSEFTSFAAPTITGELKRYFRDLSWAVRVPRSLQELALEVSRVAHALERELGRPPAAAEIAERIGVPPERVATAHEVLQARYSVSFDPVHDEDEGEGSPDYARWMGVTDDGFRRVEDAVALDTLMSGLHPRDRDMLRLRFDEDLKQVDIAARMGVSQMQVSRTIHRVTTQLREAPGAAGFAER
jgi:RNA polymerase sigma-B factor